MSISERIKVCRKALGLSQVAFGEKLGASRDAINNVENDRAETSEILIKSICREFGVDELWLREGIGEMFRPRSEREDIARYIAHVLKDESAELQRKIISFMSDLPPELWQAIEEKAVELAAKKETEQ